MSNIIALPVPPRRLPLADRAGGLIDTFATQRRTPGDVYWLKENAELLNILDCTGQRVAVGALDPLAPFYDELPEQLAFFPQYYRFFLSIGLDLEDLGMPGTRMEALCARAARDGLAEAELSDLQRAEARRLLARRGVRTKSDPGLDDRLRAFTARTATFAIPNKKAAYEFTHIVFYLSEYGRRAPDLPPQALTSLTHVGTLAVLEQNMDLLAEVCVALRQAGQTPPPEWEDTLRRHLACFTTDQAGTEPLADDYHVFLVTTWALELTGQGTTGPALAPARTTFHAPRYPCALREMSAALLDLDRRRSGNWGIMRAPVLDALSDDAARILTVAETTCPDFGTFFETFARAPLRVA